MADFTSAVPNFIPEIWSQKMLKNFDKKFVMKKFVNTQYEGEIKRAGDTVHMRTYGNITVNTYTGADITYQALPDTDNTLVIDQSDYWAFDVEDIDKVQSDIELQNGYTQRAAYATADTVEQYLLGTTFHFGATGPGMLLAGNDDVADYNASTTYSVGDLVVPTSSKVNGYVYQFTTRVGSGEAVEPTTWGTVIGGTTKDAEDNVWTNVGMDMNANVTKSNIYTGLTQLREAFVATNAWMDGEMWVVIPPRLETLLLQATELTHATLNADQLIKTGMYQNVAGFNIAVSNNVSGSGTAAAPFHCLAGNKDFLFFANQFVKTEAVRRDLKFATGVRGLNVYGAKVPSTSRLAGCDWQVVLG